MGRGGLGAFSNPPTPALRPWTPMCETQHSCEELQGSASLGGTVQSQCCLCLRCIVKSGPMTPKVGPWPLKPLSLRAETGNFATNLNGGGIIAGSPQLMACRMIAPHARPCVCFILSTSRCLVWHQVSSPDEITHHSHSPLQRAPHRLQILPLCRPDASLAAPPHSSSLASPLRRLCIEETLAPCLFPPTPM